MLRPLIVTVVVLFGMAILADILVILYFVSIGWCGEFQLSDYGVGCQPFLVEGLTTPWKPISLLFERIGKFFDKDLFKEK